MEQSADGRGLDLVFRSIEIGDSGTYSCSAELDGEKISQQFHLNVVGKVFSSSFTGLSRQVLFNILAIVHILLDPISFSEENLQQSVEEGTASFTLRCDVSGTPQPKVTWNVRGQIVHGGTGKYEATSEGLVIRNVTKDDQGTYKCKAIQMSEGITDFKDLLITLKVERKFRARIFHLSFNTFGALLGTRDLTGLEVNMHSLTRLDFLPFSHLTHVQMVLSCLRSNGANFMVTSLEWPI